MYLKWARPVNWNMELLEKIRKEHEWVVIEQKEAEEEEKAEAELEFEATELATQELEHKQKAGFLYTEVAFPQTDGG